MVVKFARSQPNLLPPPSSISSGATGHQSDPDPSSLRTKRQSTDKRYPDEVLLPPSSMQGQRNEFTDISTAKSFAWGGQGNSQTYSLIDFTACIRFRSVDTSNVILCQGCFPCFIDSMARHRRPTTPTLNALASYCANACSGMDPGRMSQLLPLTDLDT